MATVNPNSMHARRRGRAMKQKRKQGPESPLDAGFAVAEGLACRAVTTWAVTANGSDDRADHIDLVRKTVDKAAGQPDAIDELQRLIDEAITDRAANIVCSDAAVTLLVSAMDAGYIYGLAVGLSMLKGGAR